MTRDELRGLARDLRFNYDDAHDGKVDALCDAVLEWLLTEKECAALRKLYDYLKEHDKGSYWTAALAALARIVEE